VGCTHDCNSCSSGCSGSNEQSGSFKQEVNAQSTVKKVIGIVSGKGGVGKSAITSMLAVAAAKQGYKTAIMDADITGPSIPKAFGIKGNARANKDGIIPETTSAGIKIMSVNLLLENETDPVVWRGPVISGTVKQFWTDVVWGDIDCMFIDMPPGTGDVPLTVFQTLPVDGIVIVTSPQELVSMIVEKAVKMAQMMDIPILGIIENMSYFKCPECGCTHNIFGESHINEVAEQFGTKVLAKLPIDPTLAGCADEGMIEIYNGESLDSVVKKLI